MLIDKNLRLPKTLNLFDNSQKTIVFNSVQEGEDENLHYIKIDFEEKIPPQILEILYRQKILSLVVEGGKQLLETFIKDKLWDEAHVFTGNKFFFGGIKAPELQGIITGSEILDNDRLVVFSNKN